MGEIEQDANDKQIEKTKWFGVERKKKRSTWDKTLKAFSAITPKKVYRINTLQTTQTAGNSHVKRLATNQIHELGKDLRKKIEPIILEQQLNLLMNAAKEDQRLTSDQIAAIASLDRRILSKTEVKEIAAKLAQLKDGPQSFEDWQNVASLFHHKIEKERVIRIEGGVRKKLSLRGLRKENASPESLTSAFIVDKYTIFRQRKQKIGISIKGRVFEMDKKTYFNGVRKNPNTLLSEEMLRKLQFLQQGAPMNGGTKKQLRQLQNLQRHQMQVNLSKAFAQESEQIGNLIDSLKVEYAQIQKIEKQCEAEISTLENTNATGREEKRVETKMKSLGEFVNALKNYRKELKITNADLKKAKENLNNLRSDVERIYETKNLVDISKAFFNTPGEISTIKQEAMKVWKEHTEQQAKATVDIQQKIKESIIPNIRREMKKLPDLLLIFDLAKADSRPASFRTEPPKHGSVTKEFQSLSSDLANSLVDMFTNYAMRKAEVITAKSLEDNESLSPAGYYSSVWDYIESVRNQTSLADIAEVVAQPVDQYYKEAFVENLFTLWIARENPTFFNDNKAKNQREKLEVTEKAFRLFVEEKSGKTFRDFEKAGFSLSLTPEMIAAYYPKDEDIAAMMKERKEGGDTILSYALANKKTPNRFAEISNEKKPFALADLEECTLQPTTITPFNASSLPPFDELNSEASVGIPSSIDFVRENPTPRCIEKANAQELQDFIVKSKAHLAKLMESKGVENRRERIVSFTSYVIDAFYKNPKSNVAEEYILLLTEQFIANLRDPESTVDDAILKMENTQRHAFIETLLKATQLSLRTKVGPLGKIYLHKTLYHMAKQWERIAYPLSKELTDNLQNWVLDISAPPSDQPGTLTHLFLELGEAMRKSPIGLEALSEGKSAIQDAIDAWAMAEKIDKRTQRSIADKLDVRTGKELLTENILNYYSTDHEDGPYSSTKLGSSQGREYFERSIVEAYDLASDGNKAKITEFINLLIKNHRKNKNLPS